MTHERTARFHDLYYSDNYDIIDFESGRWVTRGIQGVDATNATWGVGDEAWPAGEELFEGDPVSVAEEECLASRHSDLDTIDLAHDRGERDLTDPFGLERH
jgi:hypothetical protein